MTRHFDGDGSYLLTRVEHSARWGGDFRTSERAAFEYKNDFTGIPADLPYRPLRVTPKPTIAGVQTATVVGPSDPDIFCDKYGRVKGSGLCPQPPYPPGHQRRGGSGVGGRMELTLGTNASILLGEEFSLHTTKSHAGRDVTVVIFEILVQILLMTLMTIEEAYMPASGTWTERLAKLFRPAWYPHVTDDVAEAAGGIGVETVEVAAVVALALAPAIGAAVGEGCT